MANAAAPSALPLPAAAAAAAASITVAVAPQLQGTSPDCRPALTFSPSTKFSALPAERQQSQDSDDAASDADDVVLEQIDTGRERFYRDMARDAIRKEQVHMEGFLYKKAGGGASKRFSEDKLKRAIRADEITEIRPVERRNHSFVFEVETPGRSFYFEASSEQELNTWLTQLKSVVADINHNSTGSASSNRPSAESCHAPQHHYQVNDTAARLHFATASKATLKSPTEDVPDAFMSLPSASGHRGHAAAAATAGKPAISLFAAHAAHNGCNDRHDAPLSAGAKVPLHSRKDPERAMTMTALRSPRTEQTLLAAASGGSLPSSLGLRIDTPRTTPIMRPATHCSAQCPAEITTALPPGVDQGLEPAPVNEDGAVDDEGDEEDEEPNFNVSHRREIETRLEEDRVILRGYLLKQDKLRQWRRRWFVLRQNTLSYYHDDKEYEVKQILRRHDIHDVRGPDPSTAKARSLRRTYFKLICERRNYWLAHDDAAVARDWFNALVLWSEETTVANTTSSAKPGVAPLLASPPMGQRLSTAFASPLASAPAPPATK
ncbi:hypothetical protein EV174_004045 [Coemansia sp. RSA 2320]|nr:hypothetical protein EV174_004045 [Coemansia sp. RSA 2320]